MTGSAVPDPAQLPLAVDVDGLLMPADPHTQPSGPTSGPTSGRERALRYETMAAWFKGWFHPVIERQVSTGLVWCPQWWRHGEAIAILDALWTSWEGARVCDDPDAMIVWWERAIGMLQHLTSPDFGPFAACSSRAHQIEDGDLALPYQPEPSGHFGVILDTGPDGYPTTPWSTSP